MYCHNCGSRIGETAKFCKECGAAVNGNNQQQQPVVVNVVNNNTNQNINGGRYYIPRKSRWVAFWICLFAGWLGVHKFYLGKTGLGILYLCTFGLCAIGWIFDIFMLFMGLSVDAWGRKLI